MFVVDLSKGTAIKHYNSKNGGFRIRNYAIFIDEDGAYILTRKEKIYLTVENSKFV